MTAKTTTETTATDRGDQAPLASDCWRWQLRHAVRSPAALAQRLRLTDDEQRGLAQAERSGLPLLIPPYYLALCSPHDPSCPVRRQCVPVADEAVRVQGDLADALGELRHEVVPGLIRRYPDRALLLVSAACAVHCRFCTRSRVTSVHQGLTPWSQIDPALNWLRHHPDVRELLLSGGDPLVASTRHIRALLERVRGVPSIEVIRIGTRVPVVLPMRIDEELVDVLRAHGPIWIMTHFNHPRELTSQAARALSQLVDGGLPVMNQTVLLRGVNDDADVLAELFRGLVRQRVRPYYLLHADAVGGTAHLRTRLDDSIAIFSRLQGRLSGIALPKLIVDTPGGHGKVPVGPETIVQREPGRTTVVTYTGERVDVLDP